ncbi:MAG: hypothetical protein HYZ50_00535 [Deltaproteobacteria bacterium]|nr:hypothetical protein [Deltaproteobacteria bacterium]
MANQEKRPPANETREQRDNRWWVDQGKSRESVKPEPRPALAGAQFFRTVEGYDQEQAREHLTDLNCKLLAQATLVPGEWAYLALLAERSPAKEIERIKRGLPLPPQASGVIVDSGHALRAIVTGTPANERILEFNFIDEASFDCWIRGEWVREEVFKDKFKLLQNAPELLQHYLEKDLIEQEQFFHAPRSGVVAPARTEW